MRATLPRRHPGSRRTRWCALAFALSIAISACSEDAPTQLREQAEPAARAPDVGVRASQGPTYVPGRVLVRFEDDLGEAEQTTLLSSHEARPGRAVASARSGKTLFQIAEVAPGREIAVAAALAQRPGVAYAEPDWVRTITPVAACDPCLPPNGTTPTST